MIIFISNFLEFCSQNIGLCITIVFTIFFISNFKALREVFFEVFVNDFIYPLAKNSKPNNAILYTIKQFKKKQETEMLKNWHIIFPDKSVKSLYQLNQENKQKNR